MWLPGLILLAIMRNRKSRPLLQAESGSSGQDWGHSTRRTCVLGVESGQEWQTLCPGWSGQEQVAKCNRESLKTGWLPRGHPQPEGSLAVGGPLSLSRSESQTLGGGFPRTLLCRPSQAGPGQLGEATEWAHQNT